MRAQATPTTTTMAYTLLSFDLDGTLVDTAGEIAYAANQTLADAGLPPVSLAQVTRRIGGGARVLMHSLLADAAHAGDGTAAASAGDGASAASAGDGASAAHAGDGASTVDLAAATDSTMAHLLQRFEHHYAQVAGTLAQPYPGCAGTLQALRQAGVRLACVTNKERAFAEQVLRATALDGFFELLVGGDTLAHKKPHPDVIDHVRHALSCQAGQMAHVGDSRVDVQAARNSGVAAWAVTYGYNAGEPIAAALPDLLFNELPAIARHVTGAYPPDLPRY
jgi:phosphoglycolate phosphatase